MNVIEMFRQSGHQRGVRVSSTACISNRNGLVDSMFEMILETVGSVNAAMSSPKASTAPRQDPQHDDKVVCRHIRRYYRCLGCTRRGLHARNDLVAILSTGPSFPSHTQGTSWFAFESLPV